MSEHSYLIVGQGLAGSALAWELLQRDISFLMVDPGSPVSASGVAAGIFNPITGQRCVRTWGDTWLLPFAESYYLDFERHTGTGIRFPGPILRIFKSIEEIERVMEQTQSDSVYASYVKSIWSPEEVPDGFVGEFGAVEFSGGGYVDIRQFTRIIRTELEAQKRIRHAKLEYEDLAIHDDHVVWDNQSFRNVIFCEGHRVSGNPWFDSIPYRHAKGEILTLNIPELNLDHILNCGIFVLPLGNELFKIGATYEWQDLSEEPTEAGREELVGKFENICSLPYTVTDHQAAVRPIAFDRAPVAGRHPEIPSLSLLNGFGSKGVLYAPYYSRMLLDHLEEGKPIDDKVSIKAHWKPERTTDGHR